MQDSFKILAGFWQDLCRTLEHLLMIFGDTLIWKSTGNPSGILEDFLLLLLLLLPLFSL